MAFTFPAMVAEDPGSNSVVKNVAFQVYAVTDTTFTTPLPITDTFNNPLAGNILNSGTKGIFPQFQQATNSTVVITDATHVYAWTINCVQQDSAISSFINTPGSATATALNATYAPVASPAFTGTVSGVTKGMVGLGNVDNTSDVNKPVSTAQTNAFVQPAHKNSGPAAPLYYVNAADYGAVADLSTDIIGPINSALAALGSNPGVVVIPPGKYLANSANPINMKTNQGLWASPGTVLIRVRNSGAYGTIRSYSSDATWSTSVTTLTADAAISARTLTLASTTGMAAGNYYAVGSTAKAFGGTGVNGNQGEFIKVKSVDSSTQVTLYAGLRDSYTVANGAFIRDPLLQEGISIHGITLEAETPSSWKNTLIDMGHTLGLKISQVRVQNSGGAGITIHHSVGWTVQATASNLLDDDVNGYFGYAVNANCLNDQGEVDIVADQVRHAFTTTDAAGEPGYPCDIVVTGSASRGQLTAGFDTHAAARGIIFKDVRVFDCGIGVQARAPWTKVISPSVEGCSIGVLLTANFAHSTIDNAEIRRTYSRSVSIANQGHGIVVLADTNGTLTTDVSIRNSLIDTLNGSGVYIGLANSAPAPSDIRINNLSVLDGQTASQGGTVVTNSAAVSINANITDLYVDGVHARNRSGIGALGYVVYAPQSGAGSASNGSFSRLYKDGIAQWFVNVTNGGYRPSGFVANMGDVGYTPPNLGRGARPGGGLWYSNNGQTSTALLANGILTATPFDVSRPMRITDLAIEVTVAGSTGSVIRLGIYLDDGTGCFPLSGGGGLLADAGTVNSTSTGVLTINLGTSIGKNIYLNPGRYWLASVAQGAPTTGPTIRTLASSDGRLPMTSAGNNTAPALGAQNSASVTGTLPGWSGTYGTTAAPAVLQAKMD